MGVGTPGPGATPFVLRDYALLADGERAALVAPDGDISWMCFPGFADDAVFAGLLGGGGSYRITPEGRYVWGGHYDGGLIWRNRWVVGDAIVESRETLALPGRRRRAVLLRRVIASRGRARVHVALDLRCDYGTEPARDLRLDDRATWRARVGGVHAAWLGGADARARPDGGDGTVLELALELEAGDHHDLVLVLDADEPPGTPEPEQAWSGTERAWRDRVPELSAVPGRRDARFACAVLLGLTGESGGTVAAATTAMPERAREGRNFDYRYVWIRDACYAGHAAARAGVSELLDSCVRFVGARLRSDGARMAPAYTCAGDPVPPERELELPGYPGGRPVVGNRAGGQFQLDVFGEALLVLASAAALDRLDAEGWAAVEVAADAIAERWREPDAGVWELARRDWTHSRLICAAGLRAVARSQPPGDRGARWLALADRIVAETAARALHRSGGWQRAADDPRPDAALVLAGVRGAVPPDDPRTLQTLRGVTEELTDDGYCYRYQPDQRALGEAEGAFVLCGFWLALAWGQQGDRVAAARWFERNRAACGSPGLFTEEFDVRQRQLRGNLPQSFVHALLLETAVAQADADG